MRHIKCAVNGTTIGIFVFTWENSFLIEFPVVIIDSVIKSDVNELWNFFRIKSTWD